MVMEGKGTTSNLAKIVQKTLVRTKAKVMQNLGKADKTTDEAFQGYLADFIRQQATAARINKEVKNYVNCIKALTNATHSLYTVIRESYETDWVDIHSIETDLNSLDMLVKNYEAELAESFAPDINSYYEQFHPHKEKISKRGRKLLDYDDARHNYETVKVAKKVDPVKVSKAKDLLQEADSHYKAINEELHSELPKFYDYRIDFLSSSFARLYSIESTFHTETGRLTDHLRQIMEAVPKSDKRLQLKSPTKPEHMVLERQSSGGQYSEVDDEKKEGCGSPKEKSKDNPPRDANDEQLPDEPSFEHRKNETEPDFHFGYVNLPASPTSPTSETTPRASSNNISVPMGEQRVATHAYTAEDEDELTFEAGEVITVVEFDDPEAQDDGWLMGISKSTGKKGVFPENFTRILDNQNS